MPLRVCGLFPIHRTSDRDCLENARLAWWWPTLRAMESRKYPTDLSDNAWRCILHQSTPSRAGRTGTPQAPRLTGDPERRLLRAQERLSMAAFAPRLRTPWKTVYDWFRRWRIDGTWERLNAGLRERLRSQVGRDQHPSAGIVDSQSAKTTGVGQGVCGAGFGPERRGCPPLPQADTREGGVRMGEGMAQGGSQRRPQPVTSAQGI
jgi:transposase